jgi:hypothetical protein
MNIFMLDPRATPDHVGFIPSFLDEADPRPAAEQFNENYIGGWRPQEGFKLRGLSLKYPGDPAMLPLAFIHFRNEKIFIYPHAYVCIIQPDGAFEACRMD